MKHLRLIAAAVVAKTAKRIARATLGGQQQLDKFMLDLQLKVKEGRLWTTLTPHEQLTEFRQALPPNVWDAIDGCSNMDQLVASFGSDFDGDRTSQIIDWIKGQVPELDNSECAALIAVAESPEMFAEVTEVADNLFGGMGQRVSEVFADAHGPGDTVSIGIMGMRTRGVPTATAAPRGPEHHCDHEHGSMPCDQQQR